MKNKSALLKICAIAAAIVVAVASLANLSTAPVNVSFNDKAVHFAVYLVLAGLFTAAWRQRLLALMLACGLGLLLEILQSYTGYRYFEWLDMLANALGAFVGVALAALFAQWLGKPIR